MKRPLPIHFVATGHTRVRPRAAMPRGKPVPVPLTVPVPGRLLFLSGANNENHPDFVFILAGDTVSPACYAELQKVHGGLFARGDSVEIDLSAGYLTKRAGSGLLTSLLYPSEKSISCAVVSRGEPAQFTIALDLLKTSGMAALLRDAKKAGSFDRNEVTVKPGETIKFDLCRRGGSAARIAAPLRPEDKRKTQDLMETNQPRTWKFHDTTAPDDWNR